MLALLVFKLTGDIRLESRWGELVRLWSLGKTSELLDDYAELNKNWKGNPLFLYNYGTVLNKAREYSNSNTIVLKCEKYYNDYDVQMLIADNYHNHSDWNKSLEHYELASRMCPNRFMPLYCQFLTYDKMGEYEKAKSLAAVI